MTVGLPLPGVVGWKSAAAAASHQCLALLERLQLSAAAAPLAAECPNGMSTGLFSMKQQQLQPQVGSRKCRSSLDVMSDGPGDAEGPHEEPLRSPRGVELCAGVQRRETAAVAAEEAQEGQPPFRDSKKLRALWQILKEEGEQEERAKTPQRGDDFRGRDS